MKPRTTIYIGGPDRDALADAIFHGACSAGLLPVKRPPRGKRARDPRAWVIVQANALWAWVVAIQAQLELVGARAFVKVEEHAAA